MQWKQPPRIKIYEALGAIGDGRVRMDGETAKVYSSSLNKFYDVVFDSQTNVISANDNGSFWQGYLGYPAISYLMLRGVISCEKKFADYLKGFAWKEINTKFKNDFDKTETFVRDEMVRKFNIDLQEFDKEIAKIEEQLVILALNKPEKRAQPPKE